MSSEDRTITILVLGDGQVGKSSLISTFVSRYFLSEGIPGLMTRVQLPRSDKQPVTTIVDSQQGDLALAHGSSPPPRVDSVVLVYDLSRTETFTRLEQYWLPLLERAYNGKIPVIVAENKYDLYVAASASSTEATSNVANNQFHRSPSEDALLQRKRQQIVAMMQQFPFVRQSIKCSAKDFLRVDDVFLKAQQAVLYPFNPLYDLQRGRLSQPLQRALMRMFRMYDIDQDGFLSDDEMNRFQRQVVFLDYELVTWKKIVSRHDPTLPSPVLSPDGKFTVTGFLVIFDVCINQNRLEKVWEALRVFGYDDDLQLVMEEEPGSIAARDGAIKGSNKKSPKVSWKLSSSARRFLVGLFQQYASSDELSEDGGGGEERLLFPQDMARLFSIVDPPLPPWSVHRTPVLFQNAWAQPKHYSSRPPSSSPDNSSLSENTQVEYNVSVSPVTDDAANNPLSSSGVSILSASDSLPSVGSAAAATAVTTSLSQKPMSLTEWMGHWHLIAATSLQVAKQELFRLGFVEQQYRLNHHRYKRGGTPLPSLPYKSQEIRVLVVGSGHRTGVLRSLCFSDHVTDGSPPVSFTSSLTPSSSFDIPSPETSQAFVKLKRNRPKRLRTSSQTTSPKLDEVVTHFVFTNVPELSVPDIFMSGSKRPFDMVVLVFDAADMKSLDHCKLLERKYLKKDLPRVYVAANLGEGGDEVTRTNVLRAATLHCSLSELEGQPLLFSSASFTAASRRALFLDLLARCYLRREPGIAGLQSSPYEAQRRRRDQLVKGIGFGFLVVIGVGICSLALFKNWLFTPSSSASSRKK